MFWERFYSLCLEAGVKPNSIREELGISSTGAMTKWKTKGIIPNKRTLKVIAAYFKTSVEYLLGESDERHPPAPLAKEKTPTPEEGMGEDWVADQLREMLVAAGWIAEGEGVSEEQEEFLIANIRVLKAHFQGGKNS